MEAKNEAAADKLQITTARLNPADLALVTLRQVEGGAISMVQLHGLIARLTSIAGDCLRTTERGAATVEALSMAADGVSQDFSEPVDLAYTVESMDRALIESDRVLEDEDAQAEAASIALHADMRAAAIVEARRHA